MLNSLCRQSVVTLVLAALIWLALDWAVSESPTIRDTIDTRNDSAHLTHKSQLAHLVEEMHLLARTKRPKLVFLGGSSAEYAFQVREMGTVFPEYEVHSLCLNGAYGGGSSTETYEILKAAAAYIQPEVRQQSVFVYGMLPQTFAASATPIEVHFSPARLRLFPRLYKVHGTEAIPRLGSAGTVFLHRLIRPFWIVKRVYVVATETSSVLSGIAWLEGSSDHALSELAVFDAPDDPDRRQAIARHAESLAGNKSPKGEYHQEKIAAVHAMLEFCAKNRLRFIVVALPLGEMSRDDAMVGFLDTMESMVARDNNSGTLRYLDHSATISEPMMNDLYHIKPSAAKHYAKIFKKDWPYAK